MATEYVTHRDLDALKTEMRGEFAQLRGEFAELRGELREFRGEVRGELGLIRGEMRSYAKTRTVVLANIGSAIGVASVVIAAARLA